MQLAELILVYLPRANALGNNCVSTKKIAAACTTFVCSGRDNYILEATYRFNNYNHISVLFPHDSITPTFCFLQQLIYVPDTDKLTNQATGRQVGGQKDRVTSR